MELWMYLSMALLLALAGVLLLWTANRSGNASPAAQRRFHELLKTGVRSGSPEEGWILASAERMGGKTLGKIFVGSDQEEMTRLLKQAGWHAPRKRLVFWSATWLTPFALALLGGVFGAADGDMTGTQKMALVFVAFVLGFLAPRYLLRYRAAARRNALAREMPTAIYLLRMLFDAGLSTEHTIRVMHEEGRILMPNLSEELVGVLQRFDAGHDRAEALSEMAAPLEVNELSDTVAIIKQVTRYGGNIRESLANFAQLIEERQQSAMREYVNRLSAKMSIVMMIFLFPALLIFLAGPGFLALARGLMNVAG
ncbi:type II secretion system F family protein [Methylotuvimicrobium alcaliphilum]|uniref:Type II secretion system protein n=1 Tax=Methylotuvimicrobium alcaliphilum (strain DSM 19304 / NCIMB 14124 / VKM B-2133 / 20Z) TaxID=1091494 RepID=G4T3N4_META2|nr:type II secretion system F family protein [Methylotuvimicrobium alcaliphilum]CCE24840.1 Type II secretion system protein [Methylotuvimicrobium alcaliphilum 20Z]